jgi:holliday junction DNA helicase RuvA
MIAYIEGTVLLIETTYAVINVNGVGYQLLMSKTDLEHLTESGRARFFVHTHVREDALELYGFSGNLHKQIFLLLISVSGIGPKLALTILSCLSPSELIGAVINKDIAKLSSVPGIGKKTAERLSLELREKALKIDYMPAEQPTDSSVRSNLEQAIRGLGYSKSQSDKALMSLAQQDLELPFEALIKKTLNILSGSAL